MNRQRRSVNAAYSETRGRRASSPQSHRVGSLVTVTPLLVEMGETG
jgi:hypothetical protein